MEKLRTGKFKEDIATKEEFYKAVSEIKCLVEKYNWQDKMVHPYSFKISIKDLIDGWDYACSFSSKRLLISEVNYMIELLEVWVKEEEEEPKVTVRAITDGKVSEVPQSVAEELMSLGFVEIVQ